MQKNEPGPLSYTIHKEKLKMDERPKCETGSHQNQIEEHIGSNLFDLSCSNFLLDMSPKGRETKAKNELLGLHQDKKLLYSKEKSQQNQKKPRVWEKVSANVSSEKGLVTKI